MTDPESGGERDPRNPDERYPDVPEDADGMDAIVRELAKIDESHDRKAMGLLMCAATEFRYARYDGLLDELGGDDITFAEFAERVIERADQMDLSSFPRRVPEDGDE